MLSKPELKISSSLVLFLLRRRAWYGFLGSHLVLVGNCWDVVASVVIVRIESLLELLLFLGLLLDRFLGDVPLRVEFVLNLIQSLDSLDHLPVLSQDQCEDLLLVLINLHGLLIDHSLQIL